MASLQATETTLLLDPQRASATVERTWSESILPALIDYIRIPNKSPSFDPLWREHGFMDHAVALVEAWCKARAPAGASVEVVRIEDRTPVILIEVPGTVDDTVLLYGHLDKQPEMVGWEEGLGPWTPVLNGDRLYGRGGADDGYSAFASLTAVNLLCEQNIPRARCVILIEACEESGSFDLPFYIDHLANRIGHPTLIVCLDSGCGNYDQLWCTTSLRGMITGELAVTLLREGVHSGDGSGIVASSFRVMRAVLSRLENANTGAILPEYLHIEIPPDRIAQAKKVAATLGDEVWSKFPLHDGVRPISDDLSELILNRTWRPALSVTGADGLPAIQDAGNVLRPRTAVKLSLRLPPTLDADAALERLRPALEADPPYGARIAFEHAEASAGWNAPRVASWLDTSLNDASNQFFGRDAMYMGEGGSIPFMGMLGKKFPSAQFLITGVLGPHSNAHGPNEFLHLPTARKLTLCVASVLADHARVEMTATNTMERSI
jgi:acetylornithine deacetylase/succinyl-diaminopimelate desuccinylase-like protein